MRHLKNKKQMNPKTPDDEIQLRKWPKSSKGNWKSQELNKKFKQNDLPIS